jgi:hypothetical protein
VHQVIAERRDGQNVLSTHTREPLNKYKSLPIPYMMSLWIGAA